MTATEPGNQADRGPEEHYESEPFERPAGSRPARIDWEAEVPESCWVRAQVRAAPTREALARAAWRGRGGEGGWLQCGDGIEAAGGWLQYRLALGARNGCGTPRVTQIRVTWR